MCSTLLHWLLTTQSMTAYSNQVAVSREVRQMGRHQGVVRYTRARDGRIIPGGTLTHYTDHFSDPSSEISPVCLCVCVCVCVCVCSQDNYTRGQRLLRWATVTEQSGPKSGGAVFLSMGELCRHLTQCRMDRGLAPYQVVS